MPGPRGKAISQPGPAAQGIGSLGLQPGLCCQRPKGSSQEMVLLGASCPLAPGHLACQAPLLAVCRPPAGGLQNSRGHTLVWSHRGQ
eukprot:1988156-Lingulodinium_polyedra.AAC.1